MVANAHIIWSEEEIGDFNVKNFVGDNLRTVYLSITDQSPRWGGLLPLTATREFANDEIGLRNAWDELDQILVTWAKDHERGKPVTRDQRWGHFWRVSDLGKDDFEECLGVLKKQVDDDRERLLQCVELMVKFMRTSQYCCDILVRRGDIQFELEYTKVWRD